MVAAVGGMVGGSNLAGERKVGECRRQNGEGIPEASRAVRARPKGLLEASRPCAVEIDSARQDAVEVHRAIYLPEICR